MRNSSWTLRCGVARSGGVVGLARLETVVDGGRRIGNGFLPFPVFRCCELILPSSPFGDCYRTVIVSLSIRQYPLITGVFDRSVQACSKSVSPFYSLLFLPELYSETP